MDMKDTALSLTDMTTADVRDIYPYNVIYHITGKQPDPVDINLRGFMEALDSLSEKEQEVLLLRYRDRQSGREAARNMNVSYERICNLESRALRKLRYPAWQKAMKNPSYTDVIHPLGSDEEPLFLVMERDYLVDIQYGELMNALGNNPHRSYAGYAAFRIIFDMAAYVSDELVLLKTTVPSEQAAGREDLNHDLRTRLNILSLVCRKKYKAALDSIRTWLNEKSKYDYLTYDEAQFFSMLHIVMRENMNIGNGVLENASEDAETRDNDDVTVYHSAANTEIDELPLSRRTINILKRMKCYDTDDVAMIGRRRLSSSRGCGEKAVNELAEQMKKLGYYW